MKAAVLHGPRELRVEERPRPAPGKGEVLLRVGATGVCGSDLHVVNGVSPEPMAPNPVLGHETMGTVVAVGEGVQAFQPGQRVGVEPLIGCGQCDFCRSGNYHLCTRLELIGMERLGGFAEYLVAPQDKVFTLPDSVSDEAAAILDCVAVAVHVLNRAPLELGDTVVVLGGGTIGLIIAQLAKARGAARVVVTDLSERRLALAREVGADEAVNAGSQPFEELKARLGGRVDVVIEAVGGKAPTINQALQLVRPRGTIVFMGIFIEPVPVDLWQALRYEVTIRAAWSYAYHDMKREFATALELAAGGQLKLDPLVTHRFTLDRVAEAFAQAGRASEAVKVVVRP
ncbi:MAG: galactitol-1-phosphate 5-dehydrogenase [Bacillota bacterium]|nr:galactitol-1-phosphate 5-dehydrogenase [Bacillota bacterium]